MIESILDRDIIGLTDVCVFWGLKVLYFVRPSR